MLAPPPLSVAAAEDVIDPSGPTRTCIGCRQKCRAVELLRVVAVAGVVTPDPRRRLPGRGAWLHPDPGCLDMAERRRAFGRAFRVSEHLDTSTVRRLLHPEDGGPADRTGPERRDVVRSDKPPGNRKQVDPT
ncbi:YlxR family protein [Nakamurella sp.]|uniref:YlxR family protein n=1 Tax=Nakamurella sp. TaxID=1869182 RepID=UPI003B3B389B